MFKSIQGFEFDDSFKLGVFCCTSIHFAVEPCTSKFIKKGSLILDWIVWSMDISMVSMDIRDMSIHSVDMSMDICMDGSMDSMDMSIDGMDSTGCPKKSVPQNPKS